MKLLNPNNKILIAALASIGNVSASDERLSVPIGSLDALQEKVLSGTKADLEWKISYPVSNFNETDAEVTVQFITAAIGPRWNVQFGTRVNGGDYREFYNGVSEDNENYDLEPGTIVSRDFVGAGLDIEFIARHQRSRVEGQWISSADSRLEHLIVEVNNGDPVPDVAPVPGQRSVADILAPYSKDGIITIGDNQKIFLFELYTSDSSHLAFDLQDLVLLVSYEQVSIES